MILRFPDEKPAGVQQIWLVADFREDKWLPFMLGFSYSCTLFPLLLVMDDFSSRSRAR
jgi:hypothetical protein